MKFISVRGQLKDDKIVVELDRPCRCYIALAEFFIPVIDNKNSVENNVDIYCDQIDSSFLNPNRLLKRLIFNETKPTQTYNRFLANWFDFKLLDSQDKFLTLKIERTNGNQMRFKNKKEIFLTLAMKSITDEDRWLRI